MSLCRSPPCSQQKFPLVCLSHRMRQWSYHWSLNKDTVSVTQCHSIQLLVSVRTCNLTSRICPGAVLQFEARGIVVVAANYRVDQKKGRSQKTKIGHGGGF